jgi:putative ABC transport system permease protein
MGAISALDFKLGARMLRRYPGLSIIGGFALSVAIAVGALAFQLVRNQLSPSLPLDEGDRVVRIENVDRATRAPQPRALYDFQLWRDALTSVEQLGAARSTDRNLILPEVPPQPVQVAEMTPNAFALTRVPPLLGRPLVEADAVPGAPDVAVIGYELWRDRLGGDPDIVGRTVQLGDTRATVVGVMPEGFGFPRFQQAWLPLRETANAAGEGPPVLVFGRLAPGSTLESARAELETVGARPANLQPRLVPFATAVPPVSSWILMLAMFVGVLAVLLGISANVATLMFARTALRESEIVVRTALGATRRRIVSQLLVESLVLAGAATLVGLLIARGIMQLIWYQQVVVRQVPMPFWRGAGLEPVTVLWAIGLALVGAMVVGLLPGLKATRADVRGALARSQADASGMRFGGVWSFVIVAQVAFSVLTLPIAVGTTSEGLRDRRARAAFPSQDYLTFEAQFDEAEGTRLEGAYAEIERRLMAEPSIAAVTRATALPGTSHTARLLEARRGTEEPQVVFGKADGMTLSSYVDLDFFDVFALPMLAGRAFDFTDPGAQTVVVNESLAQTLGGDPVGMQVRYAAPRGDGGVIRGEPGPWLEVVGVVTNTGQAPTDGGDAEMFYLAARPADVNPGYFAARLRGDPGNLAARIPTIALEVDPGLRVYRALRLDEVVLSRALPGRMAYIAAMSVIALAITLSAAGLFALMAVAVERRRREIGIRVALGASPRGVLRAIFARAAAQLGGGIVLGNLLVFGVRILLAGTVNLSSMVPLMLAISTLMITIGIAASAVPALRALRVQPTEAIRGVR